MSDGTKVLPLPHHICFSLQSVLIMDVFLHVDRQNEISLNFMVHSRVVVRYLTYRSRLSGLLAAIQRPPPTLSRYSLNPPAVVGDCQNTLHQYCEPLQNSQPNSSVVVASLLLVQALPPGVVLDESSCSFALLTLSPKARREQDPKYPGNNTLQSQSPTPPCRIRALMPRLVIGDAP
jgi:hypothetical protein